MPSRYGSMSEAQKQQSTRLQAEWAEQQTAPKLAAMRKARQRLPAYNSRAEVLAALEKNQALVVCGETGCGKSTQARPQRTASMLPRPAHDPRPS